MPCPLPHVFTCTQGEVAVSKMDAHLTDRARNHHQSPRPHRSCQTGQQQVSTCAFVNRHHFVALLHIDVFPPTSTPQPSARRASGTTAWSKLVKEEPVVDYFDVQD